MDSYDIPDEFLTLDDIIDKNLVPGGLGAFEGVLSQRPLTDKEILARAKEIRKNKLVKGHRDKLNKLKDITDKNEIFKFSKQEFTVVYADPPWKYDALSIDPTRLIENHYPTMTLDDICAMEVNEVTTNDAALFLWTTSPKIEEALKVLNAWGFRYKSSLIWDKTGEENVGMGMGYFARINHEILLIGVKGEMPCPMPGDRPRSVFRIKKTQEHSAKPPEFAETIEKMYPDVAKLEMFCRSPRPGWKVWGNQSREL